jgi:hypothetical protein
VQLLGLGHAPRAHIAAGERTVLRPDDVHPPTAQHLDVVRRGRMPPHLGVHRGILRGLSPDELGVELDD